MRNKELEKYVTELGGKVEVVKGKTVVEVDDIHVPKLIKKFDGLQEYNKSYKIKKFFHKLTNIIFI